MPETNLDKIISHLEYFGYECKIGKSKHTALCTHSLRVNILLEETETRFILKSSVKVTEKVKSNRHDYLEFLDELNRKSRVTRYYSDDDLDFVMETWYPKVYDKLHFGHFMDHWDVDTGVLIEANDNAKQFLEG